MSENPFAGSTKDPITMLEQLITQGAKNSGALDALQNDMAGLKQDVAELKQDVAELKQGLALVSARMDRLEAKLDTLSTQMIETRAEVREIRAEMVRMHRAVEQAYGALKTQTAAEMEHKAWLESQRVLQRVEQRWDELERRIAELEAAELRRREGTGA